MELILAYASHAVHRHWSPFMSNVHNNNNNANIVNIGLTQTDDEIELAEREEARISGAAWHRLIISPSVNLDGTLREWAPIDF